MASTLPFPVEAFVPVKREPMHSVRREGSVSLDGAWDFQLLSHPAQEWGEWGTTEVPSLWTMQQPADPPHYTNVPMPFDEVPPTVPERNPTGLYRRSFRAERRDGRRLILQVGGAESVLHALVNGNLVGSSTDSHLAAEFDITDALVDGLNELVLVVVKFSAESYLEDQDHWWHGGISRSVSLIDVPEVRLADVDITADWDHTTARGSLSVRVATHGLAHLRESGWEVEVEALDESAVVPVAARQDAQTLPRGVDDRSVRPEPRFPPDMMDILSIYAAGGEVPESAMPMIRAFGQTAQHDAKAGEAAYHRADVQVQPWTAETPHLERVDVRLRAPSGVVVDTATYRVGFRRVEVVGRDLLVNGRRPWIQGVNRHDFDPRTGRVCTRESMLAELTLMKRHHINAVRTSHYPNDPVFLDLCDEIGMYVVDEADIEGHAFAGQIADDPRYLTRMIDRFSRMLIRDRNHPSVITWSLGNETGHGVAHDTMAAWSRAVDATRPVQYEGGISMDWHANHGSTDIVCPMYPSFPSLELWAADPRADRPMILCEYAYSQGNSTGGLSRYWDLFESQPGLQGGFIWEWRDHSLDPDGDGRYRYGGDFGDVPNDGAVLNNGIVLPDLTPKPALLEAAGIFSPLRLESSAREILTGTVTVRNRGTFLPLSSYCAEVTVETRSGSVATVPLELPPVDPGETGLVELPESVRDALGGADALALSVRLVTKEDSLWAPAGTALAANQVLLDLSPQVLPTDAAGVPDLVDGALVHPLLRSSPELCLWRALTENERSFSMDRRFVRTGFHELTLSETDVRTDADAVIVTKTYLTAWNEPVTHERRVLQVGDGDYVLTERVALPEGQTDGVRVGIEFELIEGFEEVEFVGLGPWENYPDREASALLGSWQVAIDEFAPPYIVPQESGSRGGVLEARISGSAGTVGTQHAQALHLNVARRTIADLEAHDHWWEVPTRDTAIVHLDIAQRGVGTSRLGPDADPATRLDKDSYAWTWRLQLGTR
ncbi:glycoside hydrolase family 2 TIM barrel-domain containing protein [Demequina sp. NBRC 110056]|uniref:glycoside hydrolase family 2 TIM barrel-domain containing protein n=1 Tax=Demequina sp. NBRC 110056 TaxID=1570345 RepID=UPI00190ED722|nr:glycoside hydrolase family 2 TIM barrel-domain containing protein [Demequina sp. NBRC 110056]